MKEKKGLFFLLTILFALSCLLAFADNLSVLFSRVDLEDAVSTATISMNRDVSSQDSNACQGTGAYGEAYPTRSGSHADHAFNDGNFDCRVCHEGSGNYNTSSFAEVHIASSYSSSAGLASYDSTTMTCSNVSCHGGNTTPSWFSANQIVENLDCRQCHNYQSGEKTAITSLAHHEHMDSPMDRMANITCTYCHDPNLVSEQHFSHITTAEMNGNAASTIYATYDYNGKEEASCSGSCHSNTKVWNTIKNPNKPDAVNPILEHPVVPDAVKRVWFHKGIEAGTGWKTKPIPLDISHYDLVPFTETKQVESMVILSSKQTILCKEILQLYALATFSDGSKSNITQFLHWDVSDQTLGTIDEKGMFTAGNKTGTVLIRAWESTCGLAASKPIAIRFDYDNSLDRIEIRSPELFPVLLKGNSVPLYVSGISKDGDQQDYSRYVIWSSSSPCASVDEKGTVTGVNLANEVRITAVDPQTNKTDSFTLQIIELGEDDPVSITIEPYDKSFKNKDEIRFIATGHFLDGTVKVLEKGEVYWSTEDAWVVPFYDPSSGSTMARDPGSITIFATDPTTGVTGSAPVTTYQERQDSPAQRKK
jgi:predicted CxxxxCH...CXXCH cytochrome family protein